MPSESIPITSAWGPIRLENRDPPQKESPPELSARTEACPSLPPFSLSCLVSICLCFYQSPQKHETLWLKHEIVFFRLPMMSESELAKRKGKEREKEFYVEISIFSYLDRKKRGLIVSCWWLITTTTIYHSECLLGDIQVCLSSIWDLFKNWFA